MNTSKRLATLFALLYWTAAAWGQFPGRPGAFRCAVIGDSGTGGRKQYEVAARLADYQRRLNFQTVLMLGDNLYGGQKARDFRVKFERPYAELLRAGVRFYAVLGNHDDPAQRFYRPFHMGGRSYYSFRPHENVRFFALDSNRLDRAQLAWLEKELAGSEKEWKIVYFHHPLYSSGARHGSDLSLRVLLEPLLVKYGVAVVLAGHDHFYERIRPQHGILHLVVGSAAKLRVGNARRTEITATAFDRDNAFLLMEIGRDTLSFQAISRNGDVVDTGSIGKPEVGAPFQAGGSN